MVNLDTRAIINAVASDVMAIGLFDRVQGHEPKDPPGNGVTAAVWMQSIRPVAANSGLAATSALLELNIRIYTSMRAEPPDAIDPNVGEAVDAIMNGLNGAFSLGGLIRNVDLLGESGVPLSAQAGYITIGGSMLRCVTITIAALVDDVWTQAP